MRASHARGSRFRMEEHFEADGALRLSLVGELDIATSDDLALRLRELKKGGFNVQIDLSQLEFIDSSGLQELVAALLDSRQSGWSLEIGHEMSYTVDRLIELSGIRPLFWPEES